MVQENPAIDVQNERETEEDDPPDVCVCDGHNIFQKRDGGHLSR